ncbi:MAG: translation elongation factor Ts [Sphaerochaetaceae bacterium]|nr:translation elongation factor Ts [Sphaerochaetaceae bacterium]MDC7247823.1 translation elongation factor Ts [Sphaerochaetaceae bacterium]
MAISAKIVKELRDATGAGMMDCKKALVESDGDFAKAEKILKEMGLAAVAKRAGRATNNGRAFTAIRDGKAVILEMACETDFVARNVDFIALGEQLCNDIIDNGYTEICPELENQVQGLITKIKENMSLKRFEVFDVDSSTLASAYIHGEGTLATLVLLTSTDAEAIGKDEVKELSNDLALHVAAFNPLYLDKSDVDEAYVNENKEIFTKQALSLGKPEKVVAGIVQGKLNKHFTEICFMQQAFVKDDSMSVEKVLQKVSKEVGATLKVVSYTCYKVGVDA